jgi:thiol-disulfide isomerase/thioredoxin
MNIARFAVAAAVVAALGVTAVMALGGKEVAPTVQYTLLDGTQHNSQELKGKVVLVNFWATSCTTCMKEMPHLIETQNKYREKGLETLSVAMAYDPPAYVMNYAETRKLPFRVTMDTTGEIAQKYGKVQLTPTTFVLNKKGEIVKRYVGEPDFAQLHQLLEQLLAETA